MIQVFQRGNMFVSVDIRSIQIEAPLDATDPQTQKDTMDLMNQGQANHVKLSGKGFDALLQGILMNPECRED